MTAGIRRMQDLGENGLRAPLPDRRLWIDPIIARCPHYPNTGKVWLVLPWVCRYNSRLFTQRH